MIDKKGEAFSYDIRGHIFAGGFPGTFLSFGLLPLYKADL